MLISFIIFSVIDDPNAMLGQKFPQIEFRQSENIKIDLWQTARDLQNTETIREKKF